MGFAGEPCFIPQARPRPARTRKDNAEFRLMSRFVSKTANVLRLVQDILRPRSFDDYVNHVFD